MSIKTIPQVKILVCDRCGAEANATEGIVGNPFYFGEMNCKSRVTNYMGDSAGGTESYDLCFKCMKDFYKWIENKA